MNPNKMAIPPERHNVYHGLLRQNWMFKFTRTTELKRDPPSHSSFCLRHNKFIETRAVLDIGRSGQPRTSSM